MIKRIPIYLLSLSAAGLIAIWNQEGYTDKAVIPTPGDVPTIGYGSTIKEDGLPVQMGDTITPTQAAKRSYTHIQKDEVWLKKCVTAELYQWEYDALVDHAYQYGLSKTCSSTIVKEANKGNYEASCQAHLNWKKSQGRDCSLPENWGPKGCKGVWERAKWRYNKCLKG